MFYVYILKSQKDDKLYIGFTSDLKRRFQEHQNKENKSTKNRTPFILVYYESYRSKSDAMKREKNLKQFKNSYSHLKKRLGDSLKT